ncbi:MAG: alpha-1,2-fucosyltransferase [Candidatus Paceibacterota bacterium]|jgi:hypothetical protein
MIIIKLQGGLGNQLFQYAIGRTIEKEYNKEVKYDISSFDNQQNVTPRTLLLKKFKIDVNIADNNEIAKTKGTFTYLIKKALNKFVFKKYHISYESDFLASMEDVDSAYLEGYWQSFHYVEPCIEDLRKEVTLQDDTSSVFNNAVKELSNIESVALHIRRGDYVNAGPDLSVLDISYYERANDIVLKKLKNVKYFVFTDDVSWAKQNLGFLGGRVVYVSDLGLKDYEELVLMAQCKNAIIANSSFSWWAAMLNQHKEAIIICPNDWRNSFLKNDDDLCPNSWIRA